LVSLQYIYFVDIIFRQGFSIPDFIDVLQPNTAWPTSTSWRSWQQIEDYGNKMMIMATS